MQQYSVLSRGHESLHYTQIRQAITEQSVHDCLIVIYRVGVYKITLY